MRQAQLPPSRPAALRSLRYTPLLVLLASQVVAAATVACGVGDRVHSELSGGKVGTIEEVGSAAPHVGWYRISYDWAPSGEWYPPATLDIHPEGSSDRCQPPGSASAAGSATSAPTASARPAAAPSPQSRPMSTPPAGGDLALGRYVCSSPGAGHFDIHLLDRATYADRKGAQGSYAIDGDRIRFASGSLADYYSRILGPAKFGLSTEDTRSFYVVCNLK